jgi:hypothetical protein
LTCVALNRGPELFQRHNVRTEIKPILILCSVFCVLFVRDEAVIEGLLEEGEKVEAAHLGHDVAAEVRLEMEACMHAFTYTAVFWT